METSQSGLIIEVLQFATDVYLKNLSEKSFFLQITM